MKLSEEYDVPSELALLYDFVNSLDERRYVERGVSAHRGGRDRDAAQLVAWMQARGLLRRGEQVDARDHRAAPELRETLRDFLANQPERRAHAKDAARQLAAASRKFPLALTVSANGTVELAPTPGSSSLGRVLAQMISVAETDRQVRLKTCASEEFRWIFFDRSKPANRHWCSSARCGNRQKTWAYRLRQRDGS